MVVVRLHDGFDLLQHLHLRAAEAHLGLVVRHQLIAGAGAADGGEVNALADFVQLLLPQGGIGEERAVRRVHQAFGDGQNHHIFGQAGQHIVAKPLHAKTAHASDDQIAALERLFHFLHLIVPNAGGKVDIELGVTVGCAACIDDFTIQMRAHKAHLVAVFAGGKCQRRAHHARADNRDDCHMRTASFGEEPKPLVIAARLWYNG